MSQRTLSKGQGLSNQGMNFAHIFLRVKGLGFGSKGRAFERLSSLIFRKLRDSTQWARVEQSTVIALGSPQVERLGFGGKARAVKGLPSRVVPLGQGTRLSG